MAEEEEVVPIVTSEEVSKSLDTITVSTAQVVAYQQGTEKRIARQVEQQNRLLVLLEESQGRESTAADEIARLTGEIGDLTEKLRQETVLREQAQAERDAVLGTFGGMMKYLKDHGLEHTREGVTYTREAHPGESFSVETTWERAPELTIDPELEITEALAALPTGEEGPSKNLDGS